MEPGDTLGDYTLTRVVGRGSRAVVWEAQHETTGDRFAVKVLDTHLPGAEDRLRAEYEAQGRIEHPNVVKVYELIESGGTLALVAEFVDGFPLRTLIDDFRPDQQSAIRVFAGILHGLAAAHELGFVHRDLKPDNILMTTGGQAIPKLADFGIVKREKVDARITQQGMVLGTLRYMSPEQLKDARGVDQRADLFSAGCILFELLTGQKCFDASHRVALVNAVRLGEHTPFPDDLDPELGSVIKWMIAYEPDDRPSSAQEVLDRLELPLEPTRRLSISLLTDVAEVGLPPWAMWAVAGGVAVAVVAVGAWLILG